MKKTLIVLIPGLARETRSSQLSVFIDGMVAASERALVSEVSDDSTPPGIRRLIVNSNEGSRELSLVEAYWNDLIPSLTSEPIKTKVIRGFSLLWFWLLSPIWTRVFQRKYLTFGLTLSALALMSWYLGTVLLFIEALSENQSDEINSALDSVKSAADGLGWKVWLATSSIIALLPVSLLVDFSDFAKRYVTNEPNAAGKPAARYEIIKRVREQLLVALKSDDYSSVTVVGHSFGAVVTVDLVADLPALGIPTRVITMGSLIEILGQQAAWLEKDVETLSTRPDLVEWLDINMCGDWFASGAAIPTSPKCREVEIPSYGTFPDKLAARVHSRYFDHQDAVNLILEEPEAVIDSPQAGVLPLHAEGNA